MDFLLVSMEDWWQSCAQAEGRTQISVSQQEDLLSKVLGTDQAQLLAGFRDQKTGYEVLMIHCFLLGQIDVFRLVRLRWGLL
jgi:hypothetical protein